MLIINKPTYKGLIVPGGKVDMMFTAKGFGKDDGERQEQLGLRQCVAAALTGPVCFTAM